LAAPRATSAAKGATTLDPRANRRALTMTAAGIGQRARRRRYAIPRKNSSPETGPTMRAAGRMSTHSGSIISTGNRSRTPSESMVSHDTEFARTFIDPPNTATTTPAAAPIKMCRARPSRRSPSDASDQRNRLASIHTVSTVRNAPISRKNVHRMSGCCASF
jgi:hypothetical protein